MEKGFLHFLQEGIVRYGFPVPDVGNLGNGKGLAEVMFLPVFPEAFFIL